LGKNHWTLIRPKKVDQMRKGIEGNNNMGQTGPQWGGDWTSIKEGEEVFKGAYPQKKGLKIQNHGKKLISNLLMGGDSQKGIATGLKKKGVRSPAIPETRKKREPKRRGC